MVLAFCNVILFLIAIALPIQAAIYYIHPEGGTCEQCTGLVDAPYPGSGANQNCAWSQSDGGYGDGVGTGAMGGHWIIEDSTFRHNTSDGLDLLYARFDSQIEIKRTKSYGNAGDQIKVNGPTKIETSLMVSNCSYFEGKDFSYNVNNCRAGGINR